EVEMVNIQRQLRALMLEAAELNDEYQNAATQSEFIALLPAWALRNLDGNRIRSSLEGLNEVMGKWVYPVIKDKNPETTFGSSDLALLDALANASPTGDLDALAVKARDASNAVVNRLKAARTAAPTPTVRDVYFSIPKPGAFPSSPFRAIDPALAASIWKDLLANKNLTFTVRPEFIYRAGGGTYTLTCSQGVPIIRSMAMAFWAPNATAS